MLHAVTSKTAAELILARADPSKPNMGLTTWKGSRVRKGDMMTAKNYLAADEVRELNRIVTMFLDVAEDRAERRKSMTMAEWEAELDRFLAFNERPVLRNAGGVSHEHTERVAGDRYAQFDAARKAAELEQSEREHDQELKQIEKTAVEARTADRRKRLRPTPKPTASRPRS